MFTIEAIEASEKSDVLEVLQKLPRQCAALLPGEDAPILIKRGVSGFWRLKPGFDVAGYNARHGVTADQVEAMLAGSAFGWDCPAADPDLYAREREATGRLAAC